MPETPKPFSRGAEDLIASFRRIPREEPARMRRRPTRQAAEVIDELLTKHKIGRSSPEDEIRRRWAELVGPANAAYSHAAQLDQSGRRLLVLAAHAVVRQELYLNREEILNRLRAVPGCAGLKVMIVRAG